MPSPGHLVRQTNPQRSEIGHRLDVLLEQSTREKDDLQSYRELLSSLKNGQDVELGILGDLHQLFILSTRITQEATNRKTILDALKFKRMKARVQQRFHQHRHFRVVSSTLETSESPRSLDYTL